MIAVRGLTTESIGAPSTGIANWNASIDQAVDTSSGLRVRRDGTTAMSSNVYARRARFARPSSISMVTGSAYRGAFFRRDAASRAACEDRAMSERVPFVVVGAGVMGLSTAWALTRRGERPLLLERFARGHTRGASHGATRNFNNAYADDHYLDLLARAREGWDALGTPGGEPLLRLHGLVSHGSGAALGGTGAGLVAIHEQLQARGIP